MAWKSIRLELAPTEDYPRGSASRIYLLRLPLDESGLIDPNGIGAEPTSATARRFWPNEPDMRGYVIPTRKGWAILHELGHGVDGSLVHLGNDPLVLGNCLTLRRPDGCFTPFRVACVSDLN